MRLRRPPNRLAHQHMTTTMVPGSSGLLRRRGALASFRKGRTQSGGRMAPSSVKNAWRPSRAGKALGRELRADAEAADVCERVQEPAIGDAPMRCHSRRAIVAPRRPPGRALRCPRWWVVALAGNHRGALPLLGRERVDAAIVGHDLPDGEGTSI